MRGGLSGPFLKPVALRAVADISAALPVPVIGTGGIMDWMDALAFLMAGATAVQVGTATFIDPFAIPKIMKGIDTYMDSHAISRVDADHRSSACSESSLMKQPVVAALVEGLNLPHLVARVLATRGIKTCDDGMRFLYPRIEHLSDPFLLPDMEAAVTAVADALKSGRKIGLFGDYDADGVTSTALMVNFLGELGVKPEVYLPARSEGYGLNAGAIETLREKGVELLICLDCGSSNAAEIEMARDLGMETVVLDHHEVAEPHPRARALVNPKRKDALFPTRELAACGVTFFFLIALRRTLDRQGLLKRPINLKRQLDLVTVGTVADMVPLTGDNRVLVKFGMEMMQRQPKEWLKSFFRQNLIFSQRLDGYALSFIIIPRINAAGRVCAPDGRPRIPDRDGGGRMRQAACGAERGEQAAPGHGRGRYPGGPGNDGRRASRFEADARAPQGGLAHGGDRHRRPEAGGEPREALHHLYEDRRDVEGLGAERARSRPLRHGEHPFRPPGAGSAATSSPAACRSMRRTCPVSRARSKRR